MVGQGGADTSEMDWHRQELMADRTTTRTARTKSAIFSAAEKLFLDHGYTGTSMDAVAELAGITKQTVYSHFGDKESLFLEVVDRMTGGAGDSLAARMVPPATVSSAEAYLVEFAEQQLEIVLTPRLMKLRRMVIGEHARFPALGQMLHRRGPGRSIARLAEVFETFAQRGLLKTGDARRAAVYFNWLVMGEPTNDAMLLGDDLLPDTAARRAHAEECVRIFMAAYGS